MVLRRNESKRGMPEGADCFTDFFKEEHPMNANPTKGFHQFMNDHEVDLEKGRLRRVKNG